MLADMVNTVTREVSNSVLGVLTLILRTRYLGAEGRGILSLLLVSITIIVIFSDFIGGTPMVYLTPRRPLTYLLVPSYIWSLFICVISAAVLMFLSVVPGDIVIHISALAFISSLSDSNSNALIGLKQIKFNNNISMLQTAVFTILLFFLFLGIKAPTISSYILAAYVAYLLMYILGILHLRGYINFSNWNRTTALAVSKEISKLGFLSQIGNAVQYLNYRVDVYILFFYKGAAEVGIYSVGVFIAESIWLITKSIGLVQYSSIANSEDRDYAKELTVKLADTVSCLVL